MGHITCIPDEGQDLWIDPETSSGIQNNFKKTGYRACFFSCIKVVVSELCNEDRHEFSDPSAQSRTIIFWVW